MTGIMCTFVLLYIITTIILRSIYMNVSKTYCSVFYYDSVYIKLQELYT